MYTQSLFCREECMTMTQTEIQAQTEKPYWSWLLKLVTLWMPAKFGIEPALRGVVLANVDRDAVNLRNMQVAESLGRKVEITGSESSEVVHTGGQLPVRGKSVLLADVFDAMGGQMIWGRVVHEEGKGTKVELRLGHPLPGTTGAIPVEALECFITSIRDRTVSLRSVWVNPDNSAPGEFFANLVVSTPQESGLPVVTEDELFFFERDGQPRLGSRVFRPRKPDY